MQAMPADRRELTGRDCMQTQARKKKTMQWQEILWIVGFLVVWFVLNRWVLPRFGVAT